MKKFVSILLVSVLVTALFSGCAVESGPNASVAPDNSGERVEINVAGMTGPTSMGIVRLLEQNEQDEAKNTYNFTIHGSADEVTPRLIQGEADIAAVPVNLASVLYNNTDGEILLLAVNTLGVLYIVEQGNAVRSLEDLKGKTVYATGKGSVPEYTLRYLLTENGINPDTDVNIEWKSEPAEIVALMSEESGVIAMMPQPYVTVARAQVEGLNVAVDLTGEWESLDNGSQLMTGCLVVRREFAEAHPDQLADFLEEYAASTAYVLENTAEAALLIEKFGIIKAAVAEKALPECNITYLAGAEMKAAAAGYLQALFDQNEKSVGGAMPGDDFYYGA